mgnify:CR=1 FL=1
MQNKELTSTVATAESIKTIRDALSDKPASDITSDDVANAVAFYMGQTTDLNDKGLTMVQELANIFLITVCRRKDQMIIGRNIPFFKCGIV